SMSKATSIESTPSRVSSSGGNGTYGWIAVSLLGIATLGCERADITNNYYGEPEGAEDASPSDPVTDGWTSVHRGPGDAEAVAEGGRAAAATSNETPDSGAPGAEAGTDAGDSSAGPTPLEEGAPVVNASIAEQALNVFGTYGNSYWFIVSPEEVERM